jgi:hypothetical protein
MEVFMRKSCKIMLRAQQIMVDAVLEDAVVYPVDEDGKRYVMSECDALDQPGSDPEDAVAIRVGGKWGFAHRRTGRLLVEPVWDYVSDYYDELARVCHGCEPIPEYEAGHSEPVGGKWGCIDCAGQTVIPVKYDEIWYVGVPADGLAVVRAGERYGCVALDGTPVIPVIYDAMKLSTRNILVQKDGLWGVVTDDHTPILPIAYARIVPMGGDAFLCRLPNEGWCFLLHGREVFSGADSIWVHKNQSGNKVRLTYLLVEKQGQYALVCTDGRMLSKFSMNFSDTRRLAANLLGRPVQFQKWLSVKEEM